MRPVQRCTGLIVLASSYVMRIQAVQRIAKSA